MAIHRTMLGKQVDMEKLYRQHETVRAVGNANMNARGDELGKGGQVVRKREEMMSEYYDTKDRKSTRLNSSHTDISRMPSSA